MFYIEIRWSELLKDRDANALFSDQEPGVDDDLESRL